RSVTPPSDMPVASREPTPLGGFSLPSADGGLARASNPSNASSANLVGAGTVEAQPFFAPAASSPPLSPNGTAFDSPVPPAPPARPGGTAVPAYGATAPVTGFDARPRGTDVGQFGGTAPMDPYGQAPITYEPPKRRGGSSSLAMVLGLAAVISGLVVGGIWV